MPNLMAFLTFSSSKNDKTLAHKNDRNGKNPIHPSSPSLQQFTKYICYNGTVNKVYNDMASHLVGNVTF